MAAEPTPVELSKDFSDKEFQIEESGKKFTFRWKPLSWYEEEKIINECMDINPATRQIKINTAELNKRLLLACLKEAPFVINQENILKLKPEIKTKILNEITPPRFTEETEKK